MRFGSVPSSGQTWTGRPSVALSLLALVTFSQWAVVGHPVPGEIQNIIQYIFYNKQEKIHLQMKCIKNIFYSNNFHWLKQRNLIHYLDGKFHSFKSINPKESHWRSFFNLSPLQFPGCVLCHECLGYCSSHTLFFCSGWPLDMGVTCSIRFFVHC